MIRGRNATVTAAMLAAALVLSACNGANGEDDPTPDPTPATTAPPTGTTPTTEPPDDTTEDPTLSPEEQDEADATAALEDYLAVLDALRRGEGEIEDLNDVAVGTARDQWLTEMTAYRERGWTAVGGPTRDILSVAVENDEAVAEVCTDVSDVDVVNEEGESVVAPGRPGVTVNEYVLERNEETEQGWIVSDDTNQGESCGE